MVRAVRMGTDDVPLELDELRKPIKTRFEAIAKIIVSSSAQWEQGLVSDEELARDAQEVVNASRDMRALANVEKTLDTLAFRYGLRRK